MNVFITGINGFVGSALAEELLWAGHHVVGLVRDINYKTNKKLLARCSTVYGSITDIDLLEDIISRYEIDLVYHLAAASTVGAATQSPFVTISTNVGGTQVLLEAVRVINPKCRVIVASSDKAYGASIKLPYKISDPLQASCPYGTSKACTDLLSQTYLHTYDMNIAITRCANIYGPGDLNMSRLIPGTINRILQGETPIIYGTGLAQREFIYISDVVSAYMALGWSDTVGPFNVGMGHGVTIKSVVQTICRLMEWRTPIEYKAQRCDELAAQYMQSSKISGWEPEVTSITGLQHTIDWWRSR